MGPERNAAFTRQHGRKETSAALQLARGGVPRRWREVMPQYFQDELHRQNRLAGKNALIPIIRKLKIARADVKIVATT